MKVQMAVNISGTRDGADWPRAGEVVDLPTDEAEALIAHGSATVPAKVEKAVARKPETRKS